MKRKTSTPRTDKKASNTTKRPNTPKQSSAATQRSRSSADAILIGELARQARLRKELTQAELSRLVGCSQVYVSQFERGQVVPSNKTLESFETVLGSLRPRNEAATVGDSTFDGWLKQIRMKQNITPARLAEAAGISLAQVYNLESGRTTSPRPETLEKLEEALGVAIPPRFLKQIDETSDLSQIKGVGRFLSFDPHDDTTWPSEPGVYVIYDSTKRPVYVGQGMDIRERIKAHSEKKWFITPFANSGLYVVIAEKDLRSGIERLLISFMRQNALLNIQGVERD